MPDPILESRLRWLQADVDAVFQSLKTLKKDFSLFGVQFQVDLELETAKHKGQIDKLRAQVSSGMPGEKAWLRYAELREQTNKISHELLEIAGGIAIRGKKIDDEFCGIAQEFFRGIRFSKPPGLTILATREAYSPTLARLMRVQFPAKNTWSLPLAAYQFANLVIAEIGELRAWAQQAAALEINPTQTAANLAGNLVLDAIHEPAGPPPPQSFSDQAKAAAARRRAEAKACSRYTQIMADTLAVYLTGPCYAGSAILLRLSPLPTTHDDESQAPDFERAYVILATLRNINRTAPKNPYKDFIAWLEEHWKNMSADAGGPGLPALPDQPRRTQLDKLVADLIELFETEFPARYPVFPHASIDDGGWSIAQQWSSEWGRDPDAERWDTPQVTRATKIPDVLNAGWACRSEYPDADVNKIANTVRRLCLDIINLTRDQGKQAAMAANYGAPGSRAEKPPE